MSDYKYLLYIDILGFSNLVSKDKGKIVELFERINQLNVHQHNAFKTLVFSDTILVFNVYEPTTKEHHDTCVMFAIEFAQDLLVRCLDLNIHFRAVLNYGEFIYNKMNNIDAYFGDALIKSYQKEKEITGMGFFIHKSISEHNLIFDSTEFDNDYDFVFLLQDIYGAYQQGLTEFPLPIELKDDSVTWFMFEVDYLKTLKYNVDTQKNSKIRSKYLQTYHLYKTRYQSLIELLEKNDFDYKSVYDFKKKP